MSEPTGGPAAEAVTEPMATRRAKLSTRRKCASRAAAAGAPGAAERRAAEARPGLSKRPPGGQAQGAWTSCRRDQTASPRRRSRFEDAAGDGAAGGVTFALGLILYFTPVMSARSIVVTGTGAVTREEVLDAAKVRPGTPLLQIDTDQVADRVATIRRVASARVQRQYPSTLRITIVERIPVVVKDFPDGPHLFDRDGVDFATAPPPSSLPYIDVDNPGPTDPATKAALAVLTALRPEVAGQVGRVAAPSVASITLTLVDGRTVIWEPPTARRRRPRNWPRC
ncbi:cell division FtsQ family protein [Mycobacterium xenopi 4042]|uniref:Cell division FtsQ family protein n=1 Tax=Mycobacterium xenopi 4042 TaxID=1299334 RepID=X7ZY93_MYCXE|nr:cell division FtsQ family protein [Mycobacterium xenopi 4042]